MVDTKKSSKNSANQETLLKILKVQTEQLEEYKKSNEIKKGKLNWVKRNAGTLIAIFTLIIAMNGFYYTLQFEKNQEARELNAATIEMLTNLTVLNQYKNLSENSRAEYTDGKLIIQTTFKNENISALLRNSNITDSNLLIKLDRVNFLVNTLNNKIFDARQKNGSHPSVMGGLQKEIFDAFDVVRPELELVYLELQQYGIKVEQRPLFSFTPQSP